MIQIGVDLGGTNLSAALVSGSGEILVKRTIKTEAHRPPAEIIADVAAVCGAVLKESGEEIPGGDPVRIGVGVPGICNPEKGIVTFAANLGWVNVKLRRELAKLLPYPADVFIENDANAAAYGEYMRGVARGAENAVILTLGTGVGSGIILGGKLFYGENFSGGELGHQVVEIDGALCKCGRHGCLEAYASGTGLVRLTEEEMRRTPDSLLGKFFRDAGRVTARTAFAAARQGDRAAERVLAEYIKYLACGVINVMTIFQPGVIAIGGGVGNEGENLIKRLETELETRYGLFLGGGSGSTKITSCTLGNDAGIIGAAMLTSVNS